MTSFETKCEVLHFYNSDIAGNSPAAGVFLVQNPIGVVSATLVLMGELQPSDNLKAFIETSFDAFLAFIGLEGQEFDSFEDFLIRTNEVL